MKKIMSYRLALMMIMVMMIAAPMIGWAQTEESQGFTVTGTIQFPKTGDLYLSLLTQEEYESEHSHDKKDEQDEDSPPSLFSLHIKIGEKELNTKLTEFTFENVPQGTYCIMVFQDVNGNGELDEGTFGPKEPWGNYRHKRPRFRGPKFEEMAFEIKTDVTDIEITMK